MKKKKLIRLSKSFIGEAEKKAVLGVLDREFLGMGAEVNKFEDDLSSFFGRDTACVVNGTAALQLALEACDIGNGDEVLVPSLTYLASFQAISATGATPIACDIDESSYLIDVNDLEKRITKNTKAIMPVHFCGGVANLNQIYKIASQKKLRVIEDAAHSFGSVYNGIKVGGFGDIACFSFDGIKNITSGEGGCIVTSDKVALEKIRDARLLGVEKDTQKRYSGKRSWEFDVKKQGWRYHMSNIMAAIGIEQLKSFSEKASKRQELAKKYNNLLSNHSKISIINYDYLNIVPHIYVIRILGLKNRDKLRKNLLDNNIQTGVHYFPNHLLSYYSNNKKINSLKVTEKVYPELLTLPLHPDLKFEDIDYVVDNLNKFI